MVWKWYKNTSWLEAASNVRTNSVCSLPRIVWFSFLFFVIVFACVRFMYIMKLVVLCAVMHGFMVFLIFWYEGILTWIINYPLMWLAWMDGSRAVHRHSLLLICFQRYFSSFLSYSNYERVEEITKSLQIAASQPNFRDYPYFACQLNWWLLSQCITDKESSL